MSLGSAGHQVPGMYDHCHFSVSSHCPPCALQDQHLLLRVTLRLPLSHPMVIYYKCWVLGWNIPHAGSGEPLPYFHWFYLPFLQPVEPGPSQNAMSKPMGRLPNGWERKMENSQVRQRPAIRPREEKRHI